jgi:hypothetical protein
VRAFFGGKRNIEGKYLPKNSSRMIVAAETTTVVNSGYPHPHSRPMNVNSPVFMGYIFLATYGSVQLLLIKF